MKSQSTVNKAAGLVRTDGTTKISTKNNHYQIFYRVNKDELDKIITDLPGIDISVKKLPDKVPDKPFKLLLGSGNFSNVRLAKRIFPDKRSAYYAVRKVKEGDEQHEKQFPREKVLVASDKEQQIHQELRRALHGTRYLSYVSLITTASRSLNRKNLDQLYQFIPLAELGNAKQFLMRLNNTTNSTTTLNVLTECLATMLLLTLNKVHEHHFYFRDIKLDNILIHSDGRALLSDLGAAISYSKDREPIRALSATYNNYALPKILQPARSRNSLFSSEEFNDRRHDIWSLGLTLLSICDPELEEDYTRLAGILSTDAKKKPTDRQFNKKMVIQFYQYFLEKIADSVNITDKIKLLLFDLLNPDLSSCKTLSKITNEWVEEKHALENSRERIGSIITKMLAYEKQHNMHIQIVEEPSQENKEPMKSYYSGAF